MEINEWADFWRNEVGVNVIPANSITKKTFIKWKDDPRGNWQIQPIPQDIHDNWKNTDAFKDGLAVICGKVWHNESKKELYLCAIDADNQKGIDVLSEQGIGHIAKNTLVEQHPNTLDKAHFYFYTHKPMPKKSSDVVNLELLEKINKNEIPALEMKGDGTHGIMYCTPSPHKDGSNYLILGTVTPMILDDIGDVINKICDDFSLGRGNDNKVPIQMLTKDDTRVLEGSNRHEAIMRYAESIIRKLHNGHVFLEESIFNDIIYAKNKRMCSPPLDESEVDLQIECAKKFISNQIEDEMLTYAENKKKFGTGEFWREVKEYNETKHPIGNFIYCFDCKKDIDDSSFSPHEGHKVKFK